MGGLEAPSTQTVAIAAGVVVMAAAGFAFVVLADEPTRTKPQDPEEAFPEADLRFSESSDGDELTRTYDFEVEPGHAAITISQSLSFPEAGGWELRDPDGNQVGQISPKDLDAPLSTLIVHRPQAGTWSMAIECQGACSYTLAVDKSDRVAAPDESLRGDVSSHEVVLTVDHDGEASGQRSFEVPEGARTVEFATSFYLVDGGRFEITNPVGTQRASWGWSAEWLTRSSAYTLVEDPRAGTWSIAYDCEAGCEIAWGFSFSTPPGG